MSRLDPPFTTSRAYFNHDARAWVLNNHPAWTTAQKNNTFDTIWAGSAAVRAHYDAHRTNPALANVTPGLPNPHHFPAVPFTAANAKAAKRTGQLPAGAAPAPPVAAPPVAAPVAAPAAPAVPPIPRSVNPYPFDFWPPQPWDVEPHDRSLDSTMEQIKRGEGHKRKFLDTAPHRWPIVTEENYRGVRFLGAGSFGCAGLWVHCDEDNNIIKRFVIKEARVKKLRTWRDPILWRDRVPREIRNHRKVDDSRTLRSGVNHQNLVRHEGYRLMMEQRRYRIYLDYYEGGDLYRVLAPKFKACKAFLTNPDFQDNTPHIPEDLIWHIARSLVTACQILHFGRAGIVPTPMADWQPITHCDMGLPNILMKPPLNRGDYPTIVLADFGLSFTNLERPNIPAPLGGPPAAVQSENPHHYVIDSYDTRYAPEHQFADDENPVQIGEKTDVWQIGAIIWYLLNHGYGDDHDGPTRGDISTTSGYASISGADGDEFDRMFIATNADSLRLFPPDLYPTFLHYSLDLQDLAVRCLNWEQNDRPSLLDMRNIIENYFRANPDASNGGYLGPLKLNKEDEFIMGDPLP